MSESKPLIAPLHAWYSNQQRKQYGYCKYVTDENKIVLVTNVSRDKNIDNIKDKYDDLKYVGLVIVHEEVFPNFKLRK